MNRKRIPTHVSDVKVGDVVACMDGKERTVCRSDFGRGFCGATLFGDSYRMGTILVSVVDYSPTLS